MAEKRIMGFTDWLSNELDTLDNNFWGCRSRSIIYEILSFLQYLYTEMEIAYRTGFNDSTHFGRMFKKHIGLSPSSYRTIKCS